jgi:hypothetical protein
MAVTISPCRHFVSLDLHRYIVNSLERYELDHLSPLQSPMVHTQKFSKAECPTTSEEINGMKDFPFRSAISTLMFAMVVMRLDISFPVICLARFTSNPGLVHWQALVRIFQYLEGTSTMKLTYGKMGTATAPLMYGYSDADWATSDVDDRRTCIGYIIFLAGGPIFWLTKFWKPCLSSAEGELGGLMEQAKSAISGRQILQFLPFQGFADQHDPTTLLTDSTAAKQAGDNPGSYSHTKHMEVILSWLRHVIAAGFVRTQCLPRDLNLSDFMVKIQPNSLFKTTVKKIMGPYQELVMKLTPGEQLAAKKRTIAEVEER